MPIGSATERDRADDEDERTADAAHDSAAGTPMGMPDAPIPDSPMPDAPIPDAGVPDMGMGGAPIQRHPQSEGPGQASMDGEAGERSSLESLYDSLDGSRREALEQIRADDELWASWQSTIESDVIQREIDANGWDVIEDALDRYHRNIVQQGHEPVAFMTGEEANELYFELNSDADAPHKSGCIALEFKPGDADQLYRMTKEGKERGPFFARLDTIRSKNGREDILNGLGLKEAWSEYENGEPGYDMISTLEINGSENTSILSTIIAPMEDDSPAVIERENEPIERPGGEEQFWLTDFYPRENFKMVGPLDEIMHEGQ